MEVRQVNVTFATPHSRNRVARFFQDNWFIGAISAVATVAAFAFALYTHFAGRERPDLTCVVHPVRYGIVSAGQASNVRVTFDGKPVGPFVTMARVSFWNAGKKAVEGADILQHMIVTVSRSDPSKNAAVPVRILQATCPVSSRPETGIELDNSYLAEGQVTLNWRILEQEDGGVLEVMYEGTPQDRIDVSASCKGQKKVTLRRENVETRSPDEQYAESLGTARTGGYMLTVEGLLLLLISLLFANRLRRLASEPGMSGPHLPTLAKMAMAITGSSIFRSLIILLGAAALVVGVSILHTATPVLPPFIRGY